MAAPDFLNSAVIPFYYTQTTGITDVNTIISDIRTALVTNLSWTEPSTALFLSPTDGSGKFMDILVTRIIATTLEFRVRDYRGVTLITRRIQIDATASVNYFASKFSLVVESLRAVPEIMRASLLDPSPDSLSDVDNRITANAYRNTSDTIDLTADAGISFVFDNGVSTQAERVMLISRATSNVDLATVIDGAGTFLYKDVYIRINQSGSDRFTGRFYQALLCDASLAFGTDKIVPIDDAGATGTFRVIGLSSVGTARMMCRKA